MPQFQLTALDSLRLQQELTMEASSLPEALLRLRQQGYTPLTVETGWKRARLPRGVTEHEVFVLLRELGAAMQRGVPLTEAFQLISGTSQNIVLQNIAAQIAADLSHGEPLSQALRKHPTIFWPPIMRTLAAAEKAGTLPDAFALLSEVLPRIWHATASISRALIYPGVLALVVSGLLIIALAFIAPRFMELIVELEIKDLPWPYLMSRTLAQFGIPSLFFLSLLIVSFAVLLRLYRRYGLVRSLLGDLLLRLPLLSKAIYWSILQQICASLGAMLAHRVPTTDALFYTAELADVPLFQRALWVAKERVLLGEPLHEALSATGAFPQTMTWHIGSAQDTEELGTGLVELSKLYSDLSEDYTKALSAILEPVLIAIIAANGLAVSFGMIFSIFLTMIRSLSGG